MLNLRSLLSGLVRRPPHSGQSAGNGGPGSGTAPENGSGAVLGNTVRTTVDQQQVVDGQVNTSVLHDVLVSAGVNLESNEMSVVVGTPRLVSSSLTPSTDGRSMVREEEIEVSVVIRTRQQLALFVEALSGATVDGATLTLTPRTAEAPTVTTQVEASAGNAQGGVTPASTGSGS